MLEQGDERADGEGAEGGFDDDIDIDEYLEDLEAESDKDTKPAK